MILFEKSMYLKATLVFGVKGRKIIHHAFIIDYEAFFPQNW